MTTHRFSTNKPVESIKMEIVSDGPCIEPSGSSFKILSSRLVNRENIGVSETAAELIRLYGFNSTCGVKYNIVIIRGDEFPMEKCSESNIRNEAHFRGLINPPHELTFLLCKRIDHWMFRKYKLRNIIVMHDPLKDPHGENSLYAVHNMDDEKKLGAYGSSPDNLWFDNDGFVFIEPEKIVPLV